MSDDRKPASDSLIGRLRAASERRRLEEQKLSQARQSDQEFYAEVTRPAMLQTYRFLEELLQHLEFLEEEVRAHYEVPGIGEMDQLLQSHYQVRADTLGDISSIKLKFLCEAPFDLIRDLRGAEQVRHGFSSLERMGMVFSRTREKRNNDVVEEVRVEVRQRFTVRLVVIADIAQRQMVFQFHNFEGFGDRTKRIDPREINDASLDELAKYIMREPSSWAVAKVDESTRKQLQKRLELDRKKKDKGDRKGLFR